MKTKKMFSKVLAAALAVLMLVGLMPVFASAAEDVDTGVEGLYLNKTATLENDGTYTINLEAYSTGSTLTVLSQTPTDVVLVLDVSGSMEDDFTYTDGYSWGYVDAKVVDTPTEGVYHMCPDGTWGTITWTEVGTNVFGAGIGTYRYVCDHCFATRKWSTPRTEKIPGEGSDDPWNLYALNPVKKTENKMLALQNAVKAFLAGVAAKNAGVENVEQQHRVALVKFADDSYATTIGNDFTSSDYNYTQTVAALTTVNTDTITDLESRVDALKPAGATAVDYGVNMAQDILSNSAAAGRNTVVVVFADGEPNHQSGFDPDVAVDAITTSGEMKAAGTVVYTVGLFDNADPGDITEEESNKFMNAVSSNYPTASAVAGTSTITVTWNDDGNNDNNIYYKTPGETSSLTDIFEEISTEVGTTSVTLTGGAVLRDVLNDGFTMTDNSVVTVQTATYSGRDRNGYRVFNDPVASSLTASVNGNTITVSGFDYSKKYLIDGDSIDDNNFRPAKQGEKLIVTITGVEATDAAITDALVNTNSTVSGIYASASDANPAALFPVPKTQLSSRTYVLDYAKEVVLTDDLPNTVTHIDEDGMNKIDTAVPSVQMEYGLANGGSYTPTSMQWDGYDDYYAFGAWGTTPDGVTTGNNTWTKITVMPANNVYYEDTFVATSEDQAMGGAGIFYNGTWSVDGTAAGNTETPNNPVHGGWIDGDPGLSNDTSYSDGSAHYSNEKGATAKFSFTGTGFDIYGRTNGETGTVLVQVKDTATGASKFLAVDCLAESGDYYQIPTLWFSSETHSTFEVTITVTAAAGNVGRLEYYLDGIKIYNPMDTTPDETTGEVDETVAGAYGDEMNAYFASVRDFLIEAGTFDGSTVTNGAVFIDRVIVGDTDGDSTDNYENAMAVYESYGPKNEVYLAAGQSIAFNAGSNETIVQVAMKAPEASQGESGYAVANVSDVDADGNAIQGEVTVDHSTDLFYQVTPDANGYVIIQNEGPGILSVTKVKFIVSDADTETGIAEASIDELLLASEEFDALPVAAYSLRASAPETEEPTEPETPTEPEEPTEPETPTEPEEPTEPSGPNVEIENPEEPVEPEQPDIEAIQEQIKQFVTSLFNAFRGWFGR